MLITLMLAGCAAEGASSPSPPASITTSTGPAPDDCRRVTGLFPVSAVADRPADRCRDWVELSIGRAVRGSTGSASVWSRRTEAGTALIVGAMHTLGEGWFGPSNTGVDEAITDPGDQIGVLRLHLTLPDGSGPDALASPMFTIYHPAVAAERNNDLMRGLLPREDFYVAMTDSQKFDVGGPAPQPDPVTPGLVPIYDPLGTTLADPTYAEAPEGGLVLLLGYPNTTGALTASVGRVLNDREAAEALAALAEAGDPEGAIPYEAAVEMVIEGSAVAGMSGGPVIDTEGRLVGIMVRASDEDGTVHYVRAVRMSHVAARLATALGSLSDGDRSAIARYLEQ